MRATTYMYTQNGVASPAASRTGGLIRFTWAVSQKGYSHPSGEATAAHRAFIRGPGAGRSESSSYRPNRTSLRSSTHAPPTLLNSTARNDVAANSHSLASNDLQGGEYSDGYMPR